jgi:hypothetical protein
MRLHPTTFTYLKPSEDEIACMQEVREAYKTLSDTIEKFIHEGRYRLLAQTALEESAMWANKGLTRESDGAPRSPQEEEE